MSWPEPLRAGVLLDKDGRSFAWKAISGYALQAGLSGADKDVLLHDIAHPRSRRWPRAVFP